ARRQEEAGRWSQAIAAYQDAVDGLKSGSDSNTVFRLVDINFRLACGLEQNAQYKEAIERLRDCRKEVDELNNAQKIWKAAIEAHFAADLYATGEDEDARKHYDIAISLWQPLVAAALGGPPSADKRMMLMNNDGVRALKALDFMTAIDK